MSAESTGEPERTSDDAAAMAEYHASRARYIRTVTSDVEKRYMETLGKRRQPLMEEINNLTALAHDRYDTYQAALKAYKAKAPSRVTKAGLLPPLPTDRVIPNISKLYKAAAAAADEYREITEIIKKRKDKLGEIDWKLRVQVEQYGRDLIAQLETQAGLDAAFRRDPLLSRAHARMLAAEARKAHVQATT